MNPSNLTAAQRSVFDRYMDGAMVIRLGDDPIGTQQYDGHGSGFIDIDANGCVAQMRYGAGAHWPGCKTQNLRVAKISQSSGFRLVKKHLRLHVNFSSWLACGF